MNGSPVSTDNQHQVALLSDLTEAALFYATAGWPVFPLAAGTKVPAISRVAGGRGFEDATTDPEQVRAWWRRYPHANIGARTGVKFDVFDVDVREAGNGWGHFDSLAAAGLLVGAFAQAVTRNNGGHFFFPPSSSGCRSFKGKFLDIKGRGGYVVLPPSRVAADAGTNGPGAYSWAEFDANAQRRMLDVDAIDRFLNPPRATFHTDTTHTTPEFGSVWDQFGGSVGSVGIDSLARWLASETEGNRNAALYWAARKAVSAGQLDTAGRKQLAKVAESSGLNASSVEKTLQSAEKWA